MPKNIVICSDGTGNSASEYWHTNVWRICQAVSPIAHGVSKQITYYDDGVGTEDFKLFKMIGGALGWGITRNLEQLYGFLIRHYDEGDNIYLFGFSRGAFTVRVLAHILYHCGIAANTKVETDADSVPHLRPCTPLELDRLAKNAIEAYKHRNHADADDRHSAPFDFRTKYGRAHEDSAHPERQTPEWHGRFPIKFVGVWDTVDAVGLPIDELTQAFLKVPFFFRLNLKRPTGSEYKTWERDFNPLIKNGFHAMAVDDERHSFHPVLWTEPDQAKSMVGPQRIEQVWFAGMHSNVGGGYPKDQLALVTLDWMMHHAHECGLQFLPSHCEAVRDGLDPHGEMYDSRAGFAMYYRYRPRDIGLLCREAGVEPKIHAAVFTRIANHTDDYAPTGIPSRSEAQKDWPYEIVDHRPDPHGKPTWRHIAEPPEKRWSAASMPNVTGTEAFTSKR